MRDQVHDTAAVDLHRFNKLYAFPDFVKQANLDDTLRPGNQPASVYADPRPSVMLFPCHSPESTWLSALYFTEKRSEYHPKHAERVQQRIDHFVNYWGIKSAVDAIYTRHTELY